MNNKKKLQLSQFRPPIVAILGHVDHGKTSLLDYIRNSHLTSKEYGEITQKIGAYEIKTGITGYNTDRITFIDTPGHEAFAQLRLRGAKVADIALLIIDAKDSVMPQTIESLSHIKTAKIPFIVVINKIDLPDADPERVKNDLLKYQVIVEGKGGNVPVVAVSAKTGKNVNELIETILLMASDLNLYLPANSPLQALIIEVKKDRRGIVASAIVTAGKLTVGQVVFSSDQTARIRSLINDLGQHVNEAVPCNPVEILGFNRLPTVGDLITDRLQKQQSTTEQTTVVKKAINLETVLASSSSEKSRLAIIIKTDNQGSLEAIKSSLSDNKNLDIILLAVGDIHKSDVFLAKTTNAIIIGFNIQIDQEIRQLAKQEKVVIKTYNIIFDLLDELTEVTTLLQEKIDHEKSTKGEAKILANFIIENEKVLGFKVTKGKINLHDKLEVYRNDKLIGKCQLISLKIRAKPVTEVKKDQEAGMITSPSLDIKVGDVVKSIL